MIRIYCQYSFGGYKIYNVSPDGMNEVTAKDRYCIPDSGIRLFSHYGIKLIFAQDSDGMYELFVNDIPCKEKDDIGRSKTTSLLLTGFNQSDRQQLRKLAIMIVFELKKFEDFFSGLFKTSDRLDFNYEDFEKFIKITGSDEILESDRLRSGMMRRQYPILVYSATKSNDVIKPLWPYFPKTVLKQAYAIKWDENTKEIQNKSVDRIGFLSLLYRIINSITGKWKDL